MSYGTKNEGPFTNPRANLYQTQAKKKLSAVLKFVLTGIENKEFQKRVLTKHKQNCEMFNQNKLQ